MPPFHPTAQPCIDALIPHSSTTPSGIRVVRRSASKAIREAEAAGALVLDLTSKAEQPWVQFSPFYPHGGIPVPLSDGYTTACVEGAWQALKAFERQDVDLTKLRVRTMTGLKRSTRSFGRVLGHRAGVGSSALIGYIEARRQLYLPLYHWVLENRIAELVEQVRTLSAQQPVVLLDYETNLDVEDATSPLSHAGLVKLCVEGTWPEP